MTEIVPDGLEGRAHLKQSLSAGITERMCTRLLDTNAWIHHLKNPGGPVEQQLNRVSPSTILLCLAALAGWVLPRARRARPLPDLPLPAPSAPAQSAKFNKK